ncbi:iron-containing alcohol dehydrogenase [Epibacterium sp. SM1979]|uniref:Alcohol dehydrogenase 2 n=1 Tax=Tritonibacter litoralis TaxID=2662264 RepID=A0A843YHA7_9RHOB|nr:iron-containing alcohol dehydrogenase [Tritonibacter litoralis]MQQ09055.1 iron-containing alcohol dehydrogenase [Tritonibacter litoralis]
MPETAVEFTFSTTPSIHCATGSSRRLGDLLTATGRVATGASVLFVTDPGLMKLGLAQPAIDSLRASGFSVTLFDQVEPDPKVETVEDVADLARKARARAVVGFGGGSPMDVAKAVALCLGSDQPLAQMFGVNAARGMRLPLVLVPTTAGTGSEVTPIAVLTTGHHSGTAEKRGISSPILLPDLAVLDADLTLGLPPEVTAATGVDAMVHAIEAYTSRSPNANPISKKLALQALDLLAANIHTAVFDGTDKPARANMLLGSMLAGQAFANAPVAAVNALAYPVSSQFHVPHGLSNALVLAEVMRFNTPTCATEYAVLAPHIFPNITPSQHAETTTAELIDRLSSLIHSLRMKSGLKSVGISAADIGRLAQDAMRQTRLLVNNPRPVTFEDAQRIYHAAL